MAIRRTHKQSDLEKRFKHLEFQLYGKETKVESRNAKQGVRSEDPNKSQTLLQVPKSSHEASQVSHSTSNSDTAYLKQDLTKIGIFALVAFGIQFLIYFGKLRNIITF